MKEEVGLAITGYWKDTYVDPNTAEILQDTKWRKNQIQNTAAIAAAGAIGEVGEAGSYTSPKFVGIGYLAVGSGDPSWDSSPPAQPRSATSLTNEFFRKAISSGDVTFVDSAGNLSPVPTRRIQLVVELDVGEANGDLREFGLFGGQVTGTAGSGLMFNWVVHPKISKLAGANDFIIYRTIRLEFLEPV